MKNKVWHKVEISTEEQNVEIYPTEGFDGIIVETKELDGSGSPRLYLNKEDKLAQDNSHCITFRNLIS